MTMDLTEILVKAKTAIDDAGIPEDLREVAFSKAVDLLSPPVKQGRDTASAVGDRPEVERERRDASRETSPASKLAKRLDVEESLIAEVFWFNKEGEETEVEVLVSTNSLKSTMAGATRQLALLVAGARQLAGLEEWTSLDTIRSVCEHFGRYDADNFASTIRRLDNYFSIRGGRSDRSLKLRKPGEEALSNLIESFRDGQHG